jgi:hypothetical protein
MNDDIRANGSEPSGDTPGRWTRPTPDRPWRPVTDRSSPLYVYDGGQPWCGERYRHPDYFGGYPNAEHHPTECRSYAGWWDGWYEDAKAGLNGPPGYLSAYLVRPFLFGRPRHRAVDLDDRLALEFNPQVPGHAEPFRCSIPAASIRNLVAHLSQTADIGDGWRAPRVIRRSLTDE